MHGYIATYDHVVARPPVVTKVIPMASALITTDSNTGWMSNNLFFLQFVEDTQCS